MYARKSKDKSHDHYCVFDEENYYVATIGKLMDKYVFVPLFESDFTEEQMKEIDEIVVELNKK